MPNSYGKYVCYTRDLYMIEITNTLYINPYGPNASVKLPIEALLNPQKYPDLLPVFHIKTLVHCNSENGCDIYH